VHFVVKTSDDISLMDAGYPTYLRLSEPLKQWGRFHGNSVARCAVF
jgi:hypothetical protein